MVPFDRQRYIILKAIHNRRAFKTLEAEVPFDRQRYKILKAIHNASLSAFWLNKFLSTGKDTKFWKRFTTKAKKAKKWRRFLSTGKDTKFWKRFTTTRKRYYWTNSSFRPAKIQNFESDSQPLGRVGVFFPVPFDRQRYKILKAIHNDRHSDVQFHHVPFDRQRYKILKAIHNSIRNQYL